LYLVDAFPVGPLAFGVAEMEVVLKTMFKWFRVLGNA